MSLEAAIAKLTEAVEANTKALAGGGASKPAGDKPAGGKPAGRKPAARKPKSEEPTVDDLAEKYGNYMKGGTKEDREEAKANVKAVIAHFGVSRLTEIDPSDFKEALAFLEQFQAGENPFEGEGEEEEEESLM